MNCRAYDIFLRSGGYARVNVESDADSGGRWTVPSSGYYTITATFKITGYTNIHDLDGWYAIYGYADKLTGSGSSFSNSAVFTSIPTDSEQTEFVTMANYQYFYRDAVYSFEMKFDATHLDVWWGTWDVDFYNGDRKVNMWKVSIVEE